MSPTRGPPLSARFAPTRSRWPGTEIRSTPTQLLDGLAFPEGPRWFRDRLWFSDVRNNTVTTVGLDGSSHVVLTLQDSPSGLGFLADGTPIVVSMYDRQLLRVLSPDRVEVHADLRDFRGDYANDMVIDSDGNAYVGMRSSDLRPGIQPPSGAEAPDTILLVRPDGQASVAAEDLVSPNGMVISPDGQVLRVAETYNHRLLEFDRAADGSLTSRRVFAELGEHYPDGVCLDADEGLWVGSPYTSTFLRVRRGGEITDQVSLPGAVACMLGGPDRTILFLLGVDPSALRVSGDKEPETAIAQTRTLNEGHIWTMEVQHPGAGWP